MSEPSQLWLDVDLVRVAEAHGHPDTDGVSNYREIEAPIAVPSRGWPLRGLIWNGESVVSDDRLGTADTTLSPFGQAMPTALGTQIPALEG